LIACCSLVWVSLLIGIAVDPEDWIFMVIGGAVFTVIPAALGVFLVRKGRRSRTRYVADN